jgi:predicted RNA-binding Zn-ribbon protein involved in translation (DUF1610 family)
MKIGVCEVCGEKANISRCEEHFRCDDCGKKPILEDGCWKGVMHAEGGVYCDDCYKKKVAKYIAEFDGDTSYTDNIVCPKCGYEFIDSWEMGEGETECYRCEHKFYVERNVDITYSTK